MTVVKINAITVQKDSGDELARRFATRAEAVDDADGFEGFELLRPSDGREVWLVLTRWRDEESFNAWVSSPAFAHGHRGEMERSRRTTAGSGAPADGDPPPVGAHSELWSYDIVDLPALG
ncbi:MAG TPA: antibiotic biosynthesis monooxygenase [Acidimicrobiales bacterium]|nr:antibiotic biosynthesis monooxygenase [Acidimicrobiales bacterium]